LQKMGKVLSCCNSDPNVGSVPELAVDPANSKALTQSSYDVDAKANTGSKLSGAQIATGSSQEPGGQRSSTGSTITCHDEVGDRSSLDSMKANQSIGTLQTNPSSMTVGGSASQSLDSRASNRSVPPMDVMSSMACNNPDDANYVGQRSSTATNATNASRASGVPMGELDSMWVGTGSNGTGSNVSDAGARASTASNATVGSFASQPMDQFSSMRPNTSQVNRSSTGSTATQSTRPDMDAINSMWVNRSSQANPSSSNSGRGQSISFADTSTGTSSKPVNPGDSMAVNVSNTQLP